MVEVPYYAPICKEGILPGIAPAVVDNAFDNACSLTEYSECTKENAFTFTKFDKFGIGGTRSFSIVQTVM